MKKLGLVLALVLPWGAGPVSGADWQPAKGPLMTKWAKDVTPDKVHPEYPRPQMVRKDWMNLNGLWQLEIAKGPSAVPTGKTLKKRILAPLPVESALSGVMERLGQHQHHWYRRRY